MKRPLDEALIGPISRCLADRPVVVLGGGASNPHVLQRIAGYTTRSAAGLTLDLEPEFYSVLADSPHILARRDEVERELAAIDPRGEACLYLGSSTSLVSLSGRVVVGGRRVAWELAEHKDRQLGVGRDRTVHSGLSHEDALALVDRLRRSGEVFVVQGVCAGAPAMSSKHNAVISGGLDDQARRRLAIRLAAMPRVIIAPLVEGRAVTFYAFSDGLSVRYLPPVEGIVLYSPATGELRAPGALTATLSGDEQSACAAGLAVATRMIVELGYVGAFGLDGVLTAAGLEIHDINTRLCAGHRLFSEAFLVPTMLVDFALRCSPGLGTGLLDLVGEAAGSGCRLEPLGLWENAALERELRQGRASGEEIVRRLAWRPDVRPLTSVRLGGW